jgi:ketosteroid isomerase-like protein
MKPEPASSTRRHALYALAAAAIAPALAESAEPVTLAANTQRAGILATVERYAAAWKAGDMLALVQCYHPDFTLHYAGNNPYSGEHRGRAASILTLTKVSRRTKRRLLEIIDVMAGNQRGVLLAREAFERGALKAELDRMFVYSVKDGQLHECWVYDADQALMDRLLAEVG